MISPALAWSRLIARPAEKRIRTLSRYTSRYLLFSEQRRQRSPFYGVYPYPGRAVLRRADARAAVDIEGGFLFHRIPKNANSVLAASVMRYRGGVAVEDGSHDAMKPAKATLRIPSSLAAHEIGAVDGLYKFVIARNPHARVLSAYLSKFLPRNKAMGGAPSFAEFCRYLADGGLHHNGHWSPQVDYLLFPIDSYDYIGRVETLERDFSAICANLFGPGDYPLVKEDRKHAKQAGQNLDDHYTPELYGLVRELYARDFDAFGY